MAETIRDVTIRLKIEQQKSAVSVQAPKAETAAAKSATVAVQEQQKAVKSKEAEEEKARKAAERRAAETAKHIEKQRKLSEQLAGQTRQFGLAAQENFSRAGEGAFRLARGMALLGVKADDDLRKVIESIALIQGGFDVLKGATDVVRGISEGLRLMRAASAAAAAAETARAAATANATVASSTAATSASAMVAVVNPWTLAIIAAAGAYVLFTRNLDRGTPIFDKVIDQFDQFENRARRTKDLTDKINQIRGKKPEITDDQAKQSVAEIERKRRIAEDFVKSSNAAVRNKDPQGALVGATLAAEKQAEAVQIQERMVTARQNSLDRLKQEKTELQQVLTTSRDIYQTARRTADERKKEFESAQARFGRLDKGSQEFVKSADARLSKGEQLNEGELRRLEQLGFGGKTTEKIRSQQGSKAGFGTLKTLGDEAKALADADKEAAQAQKGFTDTVAAMGKRVAENTAAQAKAMDDLIEAITGLDQLEERYRRIEQQVRKLQQAATEAGVNG